MPRKSRKSTSSGGSKRKRGGKSAPHGPAKKLGAPPKPDSERRRGNLLALYPNQDERLWLEARAREWFAGHPERRYSLAAAVLHRALRGYPGRGKW